MAEVTTINPPAFLAQLSGAYRIDIGARVVKMYRYDGSVSHRAKRSAMPSDFESSSYLEMVEAIRNRGERIP